MKIPVYTIGLTDTRNVTAVKEREVDYKQLNKQFNNPEKIIHMMEEVFHMSRLAEEYVYMLAFTNQFELIGISEISHGTVSASILSPREVYVRACLIGAATIAIIHNHPSGVPTPSAEDVAWTQRLISAGKIIGISLSDSLIIGCNETYYSMHCSEPSLFS